jgi:hypothetical protein
MDPAGDDVQLEKGNNDMKSSTLPNSASRDSFEEDEKAETTPPKQVISTTTPLERVKLLTRTKFRT